ncbi:hypothetical protein PHABIO_298 [Pseudomonas phage Phabio]|uniref:Uncharacterized protein n=1 Tax=Pseudomonas phage Phabio TaxID=2006668 RepID=A0A1Y0SZH9_9CAUD|nr:hypothetical protein MZD05_gp298 [Pseudomonas phage Phabio]ARV76929.1 hypothetical protein PHABIO_298 [Pseudomonas phage Phabio]
MFSRNELIGYTLLSATLITVGVTMVVKGVQLGIKTARNSQP